MSRQFGSGKRKSYSSGRSDNFQIGTAIEKLSKVEQSLDISGI